MHGMKCILLTMAKQRRERDIIRLSYGTRSPDPREAPVHSMECYWVGWGYLGGLKYPKRRRFLRIRSAIGICSYRLWTEPDKGKHYMFVSHFKRRVEITRQQAEQHYKTKL